MRMASETISLTELRPRLSELVERANERYDRFVITRHGRAEAVLLASDEFEGLLETIAILSDETLVKRLIEAEEELETGGGAALGEIRSAVSETSSSPLSSSSSSAEPAVVAPKPSLGED